MRVMDDGGTTAVRGSAGAVTSGHAAIAGVSTSIRPGIRALCDLPAEGEGGPTMTLATVPEDSGWQVRTSRA